MTKLRWRPEALNDLEDVWDYIAAYDRAAADRYVDGLKASLRRLETFPNSGRSRDRLMPGLRSLGFRRHVSFHVVDADGVVVLRILDARRDFDAVFGPPQS